MIHVTKRRSKHAPRDTRTIEPVTPRFNPWLACPITFDRGDHATSIRHEGLATLVLDPIINRYHLTRVLMDGGSGLNLIYQDTVCKMGIDPTKISHSNTTFGGVIPGPEARCTGSLLLEVVFGSPDNFRSERITYHIAPFRSGYQALLGRTTFACFNAIPHYAFLKLKLPGPHGIITVSGNTERFFMCGRGCGGFNSLELDGLTNQKK